MTAQAERGDDALTRLWWGLRNYTVVVVLTVTLTVGVAVAALVTVERGPTYEAVAVVVADSLNILPEKLPRLAEAVFRGGVVARTAIETGSLPYERDELLTDHVRLDPFEDNIVMRVVGSDENPVLAARIAQSTAEALVERLNELGPGIGSFAVLDEAEVPDDPVDDLGRYLILALGVVAGIAMAVGLVGLLVIRRRPIVGADELVAVTGLPVLASLRLHPRTTDPRAVVGLSALVRMLYQDRSSVAFAGVEGRQTASQLASLVSKALAKSDPPVKFRALGVDVPPSARDVPGSYIEELGPGGGPTVNRSGAERVVMLMPATSELDLPQLLPEEVPFVLVTDEGVARTAVEDAVLQFLPGEVIGFVHVSRGRRPRRSRLRVEEAAAGADGQRAPEAEEQRAPLA